MALREREGEGVGREAGDLLAPNAHLTPAMSFTWESGMAEERRVRIIGGGRHGSLHTG